MSDPPTLRASCADPGCCCPAPRSLPRREFLKATGSGAAGLLFTAGLGRGAMAGPFTAQDFEELVPRDKRLSAEWLAALRRRGEPTTLRGAELAHVGMPVGGICCGQLYLGGDGRLWHWRIFDSDYQSDYGGASRGVHYAEPLVPRAPLRQGFGLRVASATREFVAELSRDGFADVEFVGQYPLGTVRYRDADCPLEVELEAFSPFIPLEAEDSALPATVMEFSLTNRSQEPVEALLAGWLENRVCPQVERPSTGLRRNALRRRARRTTLVCTAEAPPRPALDERRPDVLFADFEEEAWTGWTAEGSAFELGARRVTELADYQGDVGAVGAGLVNTHETRWGEDLRAGDAHRGTLTSAPFTLTRRHVNFRIGGGRHPGRTCLDLVVDGAVVRSATGHDGNRMRVDGFDVSDLEGRSAQLRIVDDVDGPWGNVGVDHIVFSDEPAAELALAEQPGFGSLALTLLDPTDADVAAPVLPPDADAAAVLDALRRSGADAAVEGGTRPFGTELTGALGRSLRLEPGQVARVRFLVSWYFPDYHAPGAEWAPLQDIERLGRHYRGRFSGASEVAGYVARHFERLAGGTRLWRDTWYGGSLPSWFLERTFIPLDCLATQTCHWFDNGRFYGWEGVHCCPGTCQHVWNYAQGLARIFPELERVTRERIDFGLAWHDDGAVDYRAESGRHVATDGLCGTLMRVYREHTTSASDAFLRRVWGRVRRSVEYLMATDADADGLLEGRQYNTLDAAWYGPMGWISSLYLGAVRAAEAMARDVGDDEFAARCAQVVERGRSALVSQLFDGEYFIHRPDPDHPEATSTGPGCHIDQVLGQSLAWPLGLERVVPRAETLSALESLWRYNFTPDVGPYRAAERGKVAGGRWYALPGEAGLLMTTFPKGGWREAPGDGPDWAVGYFNECMTGFEYQVAAHMLWEGLVEKGLAVTRAIHDRYAAAKRNPFNEIECGDHYARAMASYGVFLAACGFEYHGPRGHLGFAPRLAPERFEAAFTAAAGWGVLRQVRAAQRQESTVELRHGELRLASLALELPAGAAASAVSLSSEATASFRQEGTRLWVTLDEPTTLTAGESLTVAITL